MGSSRRTVLVRWRGLFFDVGRTRSALVGLRRYVRELRWYRKHSSELVRLSDTYPRLTDRTSTTPYDSHYFFQAAWLARHLAAWNPRVHVDIGSDLSALGVMSAFVSTVFVDIRPAPVGLAGFMPLSADGTKLPFRDDSIASISCLHVIEHVGLGRYGDRLDPTGSSKLGSELERVLSPGGRLFLSTPVGRPRVDYNAHRVFEPEVVPVLMPGLDVVSFAAVDDRHLFRRDVTMTDMTEDEYACGLYVFTKS